MNEFFLSNCNKSFFNHPDFLLVKIRKTRIKRKQNKKQEKRWRRKSFYSFKENYVLSALDSSLFNYDSPCSKKKGKKKTQNFYMSFLHQYFFLINYIFPKKKIKHRKTKMIVGKVFILLRESGLTFLIFFRK